MDSVLTAMSGGVDSSVTAWLIKQLVGKQPGACRGATMLLYENQNDSQCTKTCCSVRDADNAMKVANLLEIPFHVFDFMTDFRSTVIEHFVKTYLEGRTPNPCIECNRLMKFEKLLQQATAIGCRFLATGHYARIEFDAPSGRYLLKKAYDETKDQSYVLYAMTQHQLAHTKFPLGNMYKKDVRQIAQTLGFVNAEKRDSQDLCFVPDGNYAGFIERYTNRAVSHGDFVDKTGNVLGRHNGIIRYTVGQRKGLGIGGLKEPLFVCSHNIETNQIILGSEDDLKIKSLTAHDINFIPFDTLSGTLRCKAKVRYRESENWAAVRQTGDDAIHVEFDEPVSGIARGQSVVLYDSDNILGGGIID